MLPHTTRMYADDTNLTFTACSITELQHGMSECRFTIPSKLADSKKQTYFKSFKTEYMLVGST